MKYYKIVNKYNLDIIQLKIDEEKRTYELGQFVFHATLTNKKRFYEIIDDLKKKNYIEIK